jgi:hypothetical protein
MKEVYSFAAQLVNRKTKKSILRHVYLAVPLPVTKDHRIDYKLLEPRVKDQISNVEDLEDYELHHIRYHITGKHHTGTEKFRPYDYSLRARQKRKVNLKLDVALQPDTKSIDYLIQKQIEESGLYGYKNIEDYYLSQLRNDEDI